MTKKLQKFDLGDIQITHRAWQACSKAGADTHTLLCKHQRGQWGSVAQTEAMSNAEAAATGTGQIIGVHFLDPEAVWIITRFGYGAPLTKVCMPVEYNAGR